MTGLLPAHPTAQVCTAPEPILSTQQIAELIGQRCDGAIGQLTEAWGAELFEALRAAGGRAYSNYAVGESAAQQCLDGNCEATLLPGMLSVFMPGLQAARQARPPCWAEAGNRWLGLVGLCRL